MNHSGKFIIITNKATYFDCVIKEFKLSHYDSPLDLGDIKTIEGRSILLNNGSHISRKNSIYPKDEDGLAGFIRFTTTIHKDTELFCDIGDVTYLNETFPPKEDGASVIKSVFAALFLFILVLIVFSIFILILMASCRH